MASIFLNDGTELIGDDNLTDEQLDVFADLHEKGMPLPKSVRVVPRSSMQQRQAQEAPTPFQELSATVGPPLAAARDAVTSGVGQLATNLGTPRPDLSDSLAVGLGFISHEAQMAQQKAQQITAQQAGSAVAGAVVPQTLPQLASTLTMSLLGGPLAGPGMMGGIARTFLPAGAGALVEGLMEGQPEAALQSPELYAGILGGLAAEGVPGLVRLVQKFNIGQGSWDKIGDKWAKDLGNSVAQVSSVKTTAQATPETFRHLLAGTKPNKTEFHKQMSARIEKAEEGITEALPHAIAALPMVDRNEALSRLALAADQPMIMGPISHGVIAKPATHNAMEPKNLLGRAIQRARRQFAEADDLEGAARWDAMEVYGGIKKEIIAALNAINPEIGKSYSAMNEQFAKDIHIRDVLWRMKEADAWYSGANRTHMDVSKVADVLMDSDPDLNESMLMGGSKEALMYMAGKSRTAGARPKSLEQYIRVFQGMPGTGAAASLAAHVPFMTVPQSPVSAAHVKALQDYLATSVIRKMGETVSGGTSK